MIFAIVGQTASGKSDLAEKISSKYNIPIINFDAFQVYKNIDKGTAKPDKTLLNSGRYFLYDFVDLSDSYNIARYQEDGRKILNELLKTHKNVILVGGSGLYLKSLLFDYKFSKEKEMSQNYLSEYSNEELYEKLSKIDHLDAEKIGKNNRKRLLRALYIFDSHKKNKTEINENGKDNLLYKDTAFIGLKVERDILYERINNRVDSMIFNGLQNEALELINKYGKDARGLQAIGYKEFEKELPLSEITENIKMNTRNYAKRQETFFKHQFKDIKWFEIPELAYNFIVEKI